MARAPSYDFERRERQKAKVAKRAEKTKMKAEKKSGEASAEGATPALQIVDEIYGLAIIALDSQHFHALRVELKRVSDGIVAIRERRRGQLFAIGIDE